MRKEKRSIQLLSSKTVAILVILAIPFIVFGCSGGGGGGGGRSSVVITYTGATTQAIIDESNAETIALGTYEGGNISKGLNVIGAISEDHGRVKQPLAFDIAASLEDIIAGIESLAGENTLYTGAIIPVSRIVYGDCTVGGSATMDLEVDSQNGDFTGTVDYADYCVTPQEIIYNGIINLAGNVNLGTEAINYLETDFTELTAESDGESIGMGGSIDMDFDLAARLTQMVADYVIEYSSLAETYKYEDLVYQYTYGADYFSYTLTGRYYDYDYGYVEITTLTPLKVYDDDSWPSEGILLLTGDEGTAMMIIVIDNTSFHIVAETGDDSDFDDFDSGTLYW